LTIAKGEPRKRKERPQPGVEEFKQEDKVDDRTSRCQISEIGIPLRIWGEEKTNENEDTIPISIFNPRMKIRKLKTILG